MAHKLGAKHVAMTDGDTDTLFQMRNNVRLNFPADACSPQNITKSGLTNSNNGRVSCRQLIWGKKQANDFLKYYWEDENALNQTSSLTSTICSNKNGNGGSNDRGEKVDLVMGSDIIYEEEAIGPLFDTVMELLSSRPLDYNCLFLLSYARRNVSIGKIFECAQRHGLEWTSPEDVEGVFVFSRRKDQLPSESF